MPLSCLKHFTYTGSLIPHITLLLSPCPRRGNRGTGRLSYLPQVTQSVSGTARVWSQAAPATRLCCLWMFRPETVDFISCLVGTRHTSCSVEWLGMTLVGPWHCMDLGSGFLVIGLSSADTPSLEKGSRNGETLPGPWKKKKFVYDNMVANYGVNLFAFVLVLSPYRQCHDPQSLHTNSFASP